MRCYKLRLKIIAPELIRKLKNVYVNLSATKPVGIGTGLDLSVSYFINTENHGGDFSDDSTPGQGAEFIIRLPFKPETDQS